MGKIVHLTFSNQFFTPVYQLLQKEHLRNRKKETFFVFLFLFAFFQKWKNKTECMMELKTIHIFMAFAVLVPVIPWELLREDRLSCCCQCQEADEVDYNNNNNTTTTTE